jgi:hypothetical protein
MALYIALALIVIALIVGFALGKAHAEFNYMRAEISALKEAAQKRLPYWADDEAMSISYALMRLKDELNLKSEFLDNALAHCDQMRAGKPGKAG